MAVFQKLNLRQVNEGNMYDPSSFCDGFDLYIIQFG